MIQINSKKLASISMTLAMMSLSCLVAAKNPNINTTVPSKPVSEVSEADLVPLNEVMLSNISYPDYSYLKEDEEETVEEETVEEETVEEVRETFLMYVDGNSVYYRSQPVIDETTQIGTLDSGQEVEVINAGPQWCKCVINDEVVYIYADLLSEECSAEEVIQVNSEEDEYNVTTLIYDSETPLSASLGRVAGPSGEETYYNLNMKKCVQRLHDLGYEGEYWVREDGVKMFGDYVMVAANFDIRPLGTIVETSLGFGIVSDCGEFVEDNPTQIDVAVTW